MISKNQKFIYQVKMEQWLRLLLFSYVVFLPASVVDIPKCVSASLKETAFSAGLFFSQTGDIKLPLPASETLHCKESPAVLTP